MNGRCYSRLAMRPSLGISSLAACRQAASIPSQTKPVPRGRTSTILPPAQSYRRTGLPFSLNSSASLHSGGAFPPATPACTCPADRGFPSPAAIDLAIMKLDYRPSAQIMGPNMPKNEPGQQRSDRPRRILETPTSCRSPELPARPVPPLWLPSRSIGSHGAAAVSRRIG